MIEEADRLKNIAGEHYRRGNYHEAIGFYNQAIQSNPKVSVYFSNRARAYRQLSEYVQSTLDAQEAIELDESNIKAHYIMGFVTSTQSFGSRKAKFG